jgi:hypothetical protein
MGTIAAVMDEGGQKKRAITAPGCRGFYGCRPWSLGNARDVPSLSLGLQAGAVPAPLCALDRRPRLRRRLAQCPRQRAAHRRTRCRAAPSWRALLLCRAASSQRTRDRAARSTTQAAGPRLQRPPPRGACCERPCRNGLRACAVRGAERTIRPPLGGCGFSQ